MADAPYNQAPSEPAWFYYAKHLGTRHGAGIVAAYMVLATAWPKTEQDWVLFWLMVGLNVLGLGASIEGSKKVAS